MTTHTAHGARRAAIIHRNALQLGDRLPADPATGTARVAAALADAGPTRTALREAASYGPVSRRTGAQLSTFWTTHADATAGLSALR